MSKKSPSKIAPDLNGFVENFKKLGCFNFVDYIFKRNYKFEDKNEKDFKIEGLVFLLKQKVTKEELSKVIYKFAPHDPLIAGFSLIVCAHIESENNFDLTSMLWDQIRESRREKSRKKDRLEFQKLVLAESNFIFSLVKNDSNSFVYGVNFRDFLKKTAFLRENYKLNPVTITKDTKQNRFFHGGFDKRGTPKMHAIVRKMNIKKSFNHNFRKTAHN